MARTWQDRLHELERGGEQWLEGRRAEAARLAQDVERRGRAAWDAAVQNARQIAEHAPNEVKAAGARLFQPPPENRRVANPQASVERILAATMA